MVLNGTFHDQLSDLAGSYESSGIIVAPGIETIKDFSIDDRLIASCIEDHVAIIWTMTAPKTSG